MASDVGGFLRDVKRNLLSLEINTILKDNMTAEPMPAVPHALLDIAGEYARKLEDLGTNVRGFFVIDGPDPFPGARDPAVAEPPDARRSFRPAAGLERARDAARMSGDRITACRETFDRLRWAAKSTGMATTGAFAAMEPGQRVIVERICNNCDVIKGILDRTPGFPPAGSPPLTRSHLLGLPAKEVAAMAGDIEGGDFLTLRKIWEIGTEDVVAQTVIHIDGDVFTRIGEDHLRRPGIDTLLKLHEQGIGVAMASWNHLMGMVEKIAAGVFKSFQKLF